MGCMIHTVGNGEDRYGFRMDRCPTRMSTGIELTSNACMLASWAITELSGISHLQMVFLTM